MKEEEFVSQLRSTQWTRVGTGAEYLVLSADNLPFVVKAPLAGDYPSGYYNASSALEGIALEFSVLDGRGFFIKNIGRSTPYIIVQKKGIPLDVKLETMSEQEKILAAQQVALVDKEAVRRNRIMTDAFIHQFAYDGPLKLMDLGNLLIGYESFDIGRLKIMMTDHHKRVFQIDRGYSIYNRAHEFREFYGGPKVCDAYIEATDLDLDHNLRLQFNDYDIKTHLEGCMEVVKTWPREFRAAIELEQDKVYAIWYIVNTYGPQQDDIFNFLMKEMYGDEFRRLAEKEERKFLANGAAIPMKEYIE